MSSLYILIARYLMGACYFQLWSPQRTNSGRQTAGYFRTCACAHSVRKFGQIHGFSTPQFRQRIFHILLKKKKKEEVFYICTTLVIVRLLQGRQLVNKVGKNKKFHVTCTLRKLNFLPSLCYAAGSLTNKKIFMFLYSVVSSNPSHTRHIGTAMGQL